MQQREKKKKKGTFGGYHFKWRRTLFGPKFVLILLAVASLLGQLTSSEERSIMTAATAAMSDLFAASESAVAML